MARPDYKWLLFKRQYQSVQWKRCNVGFPTKKQALACAKDWRKSLWKFDFKVVRNTN